MLIDFNEKLQVSPRWAASGRAILILTISNHPTATSSSTSSNSDRHTSSSLNNPYQGLPPHGPFDLHPPLRALLDSGETLLKSLETPQGWSSVSIVAGCPLVENPLETVAVACFWPQNAALSNLDSGNRS